MLLKTVEEVLYQHCSISTGVIVALMVIHEKSTHFGTSAPLSRFLGKARLFCSFRATIQHLKVHRAVLSQFSSLTVTLPLSSLL